MYIKAHPFGYVRIKNKQRADHKGETLKKVQTIYMKNGQTRAIKHYAVHALGGLNSQC